MVGISFTFSRSSLFLVLFFVVGQDGLDSRAVDGEACNPLVENACMPSDITLSDITLSFMRSMSTSFTNSLTMLSSSKIHARGFLSQVLGITTQYNGMDSDTSMTTTQNPQFSELR
jgi:hypothetical protein